MALPETVRGDINVTEAPMEEQKLEQEQTIGPISANQIAHIRRTGTTREKIQAIVQTLVARRQAELLSRLTGPDPSTVRPGGRMNEAWQTEREAGLRLFDGRAHSSNGCSRVVQHHSNSMEPAESIRSSAVEKVTGPVSVAGAEQMPWNRESSYIVSRKKPTSPTSVSASMQRDKNRSQAVLQSGACGPDHEYNPNQPQKHTFTPGVQLKRSELIGVKNRPMYAVCHEDAEPNGHKSAGLESLKQKQDLPASLPKG
ncbi:unnamed protein product, partial [Protopolystoma xenopodis]